MAIDTRTPGSPGWWLNALGAELTAKRSRIDLLFKYVIGDHPLPETTNAATREAYTAFQKKSRTNYPALIVEAPRELLLPSGFRTASAGDELGDKEANRIWQANSLDADCGLVHGTGLTAGEGYVIVGPVDDELGEPLITAEDPRQVHSIQDPARPRRTRAAMKLYADYVDLAEYGFLYVPGEDGRIEVHQFARPIPDKANTNAVYLTPPHLDDPFDAQMFEWIEDVQTLDVTTNPVVRFRNRPQIDGSVLGEFEDVLDIVDRINHQTLDRMVIAMMQAFRQRAIQGDLPMNDADGNPIDWNSLLAPGADALWRLPEGVQLWESMITDLGPILLAVKEDVRNLGAITRTPPHYMLGDYTNASAEAASLARAGLENKVYDRMREYGQSWNQVMALAFAFKGDTKRSRPADVEVMWTPPERFSLAERADAISKLNGTVPWRSLMQDVYQATPTQLIRMEAEKEAADKAAEAKAAKEAEALAAQATEVPATEPPAPNAKPATGNATTP